MANILKFPETSGGTKRQAFLQDGDDIMHFDDQTLADDHTFPLPDAKSYRDLGKLRAKDWSNQELANLFRVKRLLDAAGVPNEIDRASPTRAIPGFSSATPMARCSFICAASTVSMSSTAPA